ncbi:hypothetical protein BKA70DRAFT_1287595 [Coprinopsis sp. MPI-PUGE-AT-0042]|nr:hypothetical protein BKA70DRAFT_1287595 [Coprinopsis sp. MPI-PUGE-AT-0042]
MLTAGAYTWIGALLLSSSPCREVPAELLDATFPSALAKAGANASGRAVLGGDLTPYGSCWLRLEVRRSPRSRIAGDGFCRCVGWEKGFKT